MPASRHPCRQPDLLPKLPVRTIFLLDTFLEATARRFAIAVR